MQKLPVLIVNDDPAILDAVVEVAKEGNFHHYATRTGAEALHLASLYDFSLAFIDLDLIDIDGPVFYEKLMERESHYTLPLVAFFDSQDSFEVKAINQLVTQGQLTLFSKPPKKELLQNLFERYVSSDSV